MSRHARALLDVVGGALVLAYVGAAFVAARDGGSPDTAVGLALAVGGVLVVARLAGLVHRAPMPFAVAVAALAMLLSADGVVGSGPLGGPFGYRNATGAFYAQAAVAALMAGFVFRPLPVRLLGGAAAGICAAVAVADSAAAAASLLALAPVALAIIGWVRVRAAIVVVGGLFALTLAGTVLLAVWYQPGADGSVVRALTERRLTLWSESVELMAEHPTGVGPGRFAEVAPTAIEDADARWAHQEFLEQGVEVGWVGFGLVVALFLWGFVRLWAHPSPDAVVALGAASLAVLGIHASVDYILHLPAVPLAAAALLGTAQAVPLRRFRRVERHDREEGLEGARDPDRLAGAPTSG